MAVSQPSKETNSGAMGVEAGNDIPVGSLVRLGTAHVVLGQDLLDETSFRRCPPSPGDCSVKVHWRDGRLEDSAGNIQPPVLLRSLRCARDRHEQNVELVKVEGDLCVRTLRPIERGEEMLVWYSEELAREAGVPILTPSHIRGHQTYVCTYCTVEYAYPNTLKAHILLQCRNSLISPSTESLVPFHHLLQTLSQTHVAATYDTPQDSKLSCKYVNSRRTASSSVSVLRPQCSGCGLHTEEPPYRSAFKNLTCSGEVKKEAGSEDGLMTPDSSTDQRAPLDPVAKQAETCGHFEQISDLSVDHWNTLTAQRIIAQSITLPLDYTPLSGCYSRPPHLHAFGIQFMNSRQTTLHESHPHKISTERYRCSHGEYSNISPHVKTPDEHIRFSMFKPQPPSTVSPLTQDNPYCFSLPSDKEPLDLLPQAYFANKSRKGHLCLCCGKLYSRKYGLKIHMRTHNGYKPLKCKICLRPFGDPSNLNKHVRLHAQGDTPYRCDFCGKVLVRRRDLERHVRSRHPMKCDQNDDVISVCESSPDSSPISNESSETPRPPKDPSLENC